MNRLDVLLLYEPFGVESPSHMPEDMSMPEPEDVLPWLRRNTQACEHEYGKEPVNEIYNGWAITDLSVPTRCKHCAWATVRQPGPGHATLSSLLFILYNI